MVDNGAIKLKKGQLPPFYLLAQTHYSSINCSALTEEVTERTKEIGLRMSVGARGIDISIQFLIESVLISVTGGLLGILTGYGLSSLATLIGLPTSVPGWAVILSFVVCTIIGIAFGYIPAKKAASLDPIEAIRYE